jgi:peroxiredoxin
MYAELKDKGLELIAVNSGDSADTINKYVAENKFTFPIVMGERDGADSVFKQYGVQAYPTNYLLDGNGNVVFRSVGFSEKDLRAALEKLGLK